MPERAANPPGAIFPEEGHRPPLTLGTREHDDRALRVRWVQLGHGFPEDRGRLAGSRQLSREPSEGLRIAVLKSTHDAVQGPEQGEQPFFDARFAADAVRRVDPQDLVRIAMLDRRQKQGRQEILVRQPGLKLLDEDGNALVPWRRLDQLDQQTDARAMADLIGVDSRIGGGRPADRGKKAKIRQEWHGCRRGRGCQEATSIRVTHGTSLRHRWFRARPPNSEIDPQHATPLSTKLCGRSLMKGQATPGSLAVPP